LDRTFIIAELSANHNGDIGIARKTISAAKAAGADAVKLQTYTADTMTIDCDNEYFRINHGTLWDGTTLYKLYERAYTPWEWHKELFDYARSIGIEIFSAPFDKTAVDFLDGLDVPKYKIASFEAMDYNLITYTARKRKPMIISVGVSHLSEIQEAIDTCKSVGNNDITLMKCTSAYPAKHEDMNILTVGDMVRRFGPQGIKVGLSDHSTINEPAVAAVALGATIVEKHLILDRELGGPDAEFSLNPNEFEVLVRAIRNTEKILGLVSYDVNERNRKFARSIFVAADIKKGETFTEENIRSVRPGDGMHPRYLQDILGKQANRDYRAGEPFLDKFIIER
jgi:pseudaminic acid synthase